MKSSRKDSEVLIDLQLDRRDDEGSRKRLGHFIALICFDIAFMHCRLPTFEWESESSCQCLGKSFQPSLVRSFWIVVMIFWKPSQPWWLGSQAWQILCLLKLTEDSRPSLNERLWFFGGHTSLDLWNMGDLACKTLIASHGFHTVFLAAFLEEKNEWDGRSSRCFSCKNQACQSLSLQMPDARSTHRFPASRESGTNPFCSHASHFWKFMLQAPGPSGRATRSDAAMAPLGKLGWHDFWSVKGGYAVKPKRLVTVLILSVLNWKVNSKWFVLVSHFFSWKFSTSRLIQVGYPVLLTWCKEVSPLNKFNLKLRPAAWAPGASLTMLYLVMRLWRPPRARDRQQNARPLNCSMICLAGNRSVLGTSWNSQGHAWICMVHSSI